MRRSALFLVPLLAGCTAAPPAAPATSPPSGARCGSPVSTEALPTWVRGGFNFDGSGIPHVLSRGGDLMAILFGSPLTAPPAEDHNNKILWVSRLPVTTGDTLKITAARAGSAETAGRAVPGGPGPSTVDLPSAGCWTLTLQWSGHTDTLDLTYVPPK